MYDFLKITPKNRGYQVVFNHTNFHLYHYAGNNPIRYTDPDGRSDNNFTLEWIMNTVPEQYRDAAIKSWEENKTIKGGTLTVKELAAILFNETRSLSGEKIEQARNEVAHAIINADKKWKEEREKYASTASKEAKVPEAEKSIYEACLEAAKQAVKEDEQGKDPTNNALYFNFRITDSKKDREGKKVHTSTGPLDNSYSEYKYANTYGD